MKNVTMLYTIALLGLALVWCAACSSPLEEDTRRNRIVEEDPPHPSGIVMARSFVLTVPGGGGATRIFRAQNPENISIDTSRNPRLLHFSNVLCMPDAPEAGSPILSLLALLVEGRDIPADGTAKDFFGDASVPQGSNALFRVELPGTAPAEIHVYFDGVAARMQLALSPGPARNTFNGSINLEAAPGGAVAGIAGTVELQY